MSVLRGIPKSLTMYNNLACLIGGKDAENKALRLMEVYPTYRAIAEASQRDLKKILSPGAIKRVKAAVTLPPIIPKGQFIRRSEDAGALLMSLIGNKEQEELWMLGIARSKRMMFAEMIYRGAISQIPIDASIFRLPVRRNVPEVIIAHNHPSGTAHPSDEDIEASRQIKQGFKLLGIDMLDSFVVCATSYTSLAAKLLL